MHHCIQSPEPNEHNNEPLDTEPLGWLEEAQRFDKFLENLRSGTASPSDLDGCAEKVNLMQRQLLRFADELDDLVAAGTQYRLPHPADWAARVLHVPAGEPVPSFIVGPVERIFARAWVQTPQEVPSKVVDYGRFNLGVITIALGDAAELRRRIASGDFDGPKRRIRLTEPDVFWHSITTNSPEWMENEAIDEFGNRVCKEPTGPLGGVQPHWTYDGEYVTDTEPPSFR